MYWIKDKDGNRQRFSPWPEQRNLWDNMHYLNVILKARQVGMTTFIQIFMLDQCLFNPDTSAGVIAHTVQDASLFFENKIKYAYDNLPVEISTRITEESSSKRELSFNNNSRISVSTSHRSGTLQYLHISEYGLLCAQNPSKAAEVRAGALNTVSKGNYVFIESTAAGREGHFYEICQDAMKSQAVGLELTDIDWKFHFYPWFGRPEYRVPGHSQVPELYTEYFDTFEAENDVQLDQEQRNWYVRKARDMGDDMKPEFPGTPAEAFMKIIEGAIFAAQIWEARNDKRICEVPHERGEPVDVYWDLGYNDDNAMWFAQKRGPWEHFIDYYENRLEDLTHYIELLDEWHTDKGYRWGTMYLPHDGASKHITGIAGSAEDILRRNGHKVRVVNRPMKKMPSIEAARKKFPVCRFDAEKCDEGLKRLETYQWTWDEKGDTFKKIPKHNSASNGADAFQTFGWWRHLRGEGGSFAQQQSDMANRSSGVYIGRKRGGKHSEPRDYSHIL